MRRTAGQLGVSTTDDGHAPQRVSALAVRVQLGGWGGRVA